MPPTAFFPAPLAAAASHADAEHRLLVVLIQLCVIIAVARVAAILFRKIGQPAVVGEIIAGLVLGPSVFGRVAEFWLPHFGGQNLSQIVFNPAVGAVFDILKELGLIFLLFLIGLEFDFAHLRTNSRSALSISLAGVVLPFGLGFGLAYWMLPYLPEHPGAGGFALFMGTAMSITAIPILGRMMMELNITRTRLGAITITAAAIDDATGWILLAAVSAVVKAGFNPWDTLAMVGWTVGFGVGMVLLVRPLLRAWIRRALIVGRGELGLNALAILFILIFLCAIATNLIGIFAIFGAFLVGAILSDQQQFRDAVARQLRNFVTVFFLPIFFTYTGLRTDVGSLESGTLWLFAAAVSAAAVVGKFGGCALAARLEGYTAREATCVGVMMNTRALMELIVINVGYQLGVIPKSVFCMLVLMAVLTTVMTTPILLRAMRGTELEGPIERSGFVKARAKRVPRPSPLAA